MSCKTEQTWLVLRKYQTRLRAHFLSAVPELSSYPCKETELRFSPSLGHYIRRVGMEHVVEKLLTPGYAGTKDFYLVTSFYEELEKNQIDGGVMAKSVTRYRINYLLKTLENSLENHLINPFP